MPLDYQTDTGPRLTCRFSMGEYNGKPSFILHSSRGLLWNNIPADLEALAKMPNMVTSCKNFALGPKGLFWYTYRSVNNVYEQKGSSDLWKVLNEDWKGGCPIRLSFGSQNFFWGEKEWIENGGHLVQAFGHQPQTLINESKKRFPGVRSFEIDFVAIGAQSAWAMGTSNSDPIRAGLHDDLEKTIKREMAAGHRIKNLVLCPCRSDIYWIEYSDETVDYLLPSDWDLTAIARHFTRHQNVVEDVWKPFDHPSETLPVTTLRPVKKGGLAWTFVETQFKTGWRHPHKQPPPLIVEVLEVIMPGTLYQPFTRYIDTIEKKHRFSRTGLPPGNQEYGWHGTRRRCQLGEDPTKFNPCSDKACATCLILLSSFKATLAGHAPGRNFLRFGHAIYTSAVSSKADDYAASTSSPCKSLILARLVKGKTDQRKTGDKTLKAPSAGFDCVEGLVGQELNYEECCIYNNDAIRPAFLLLYK